MRVIPRLDIKGPNVVKGIRMEGLRVMGPPERFARRYAETGADELLFVDIVASLYERNSILETVRRTARAIFIPLTVGGGLRSVEDIRLALHSGADKVALNTAAVRNPGLIREAAREFGSSTIVVAVEAKSRNQGGWEAYTDCGRERTGLDTVAWATRAVELGAGEVLLTSVDREGTGQGYDLDLVAAVTRAVDVPVIAHGGAGSFQHLLIASQAADALCAASVFHYHLVESDPWLGPSGGGYIGGTWPGESFSLPVLKSRLVKACVPCRQPFDTDALRRVP